MDQFPEFQTFPAEIQFQVFEAAVENAVEGNGAAPRLAIVNITAPHFPPTYSTVENIAHLQETQPPTRAQRLHGLLGAIPLSHRASRLTLARPAPSRSALTQLLALQPYNPTTSPPLETSSTSATRAITA